ncbi:inorganic pyrophosphatase [Coxiella-like endosymbiont of Rhipicephalus sanguineus]|uniref:inorganic diphosphatase n=1 Tax=Coxiella-like endosymbiont of Rhipicephalus sanguineus TaxID=1955402 RepID=UPI00203F87BD|nr:inorganic diphosphatase [Coxiella-like endosymbiont of Rhipicephalus sanguineus]MBT8506303.1 inorganic pyrophosphatase [Coxiella-like endosymbiont of Rhipicephalus sanguineus]
MTLTVSVGKDINNFNTIIEIPMNGGEVKYEYNKEFQFLTVDRFIPTAMRYPCNYGFAPNTLAEDGDPLDVLVMTPVPLQPGTLMRVRAVGLMRMEDEAGKDSKILTFPLAKACREYESIQSIKDVSPFLLDIIAYFFEHYKDLEPTNKWAKVKGWEDKDAAEKEFQASIRRFEKS